mgnify:FL=1
MAKRRGFKRWIAGLSALVMLLTIGLALPVGARAEKNTVRVLLTRLNLTDRLEIALDGSYTLDGMSFQRGSRLVLSCATGRIMVYYEGMALDSGKELVLTRHQAAEGLENGLRLNGDYALYRGDLHVKTDGKMLTAVLHIPIEEYLLGVVPYEMSDSFPLEALKAQAVAARTYALYKMRGASGAYDLVDNTNDQVFRGYNASNERAIRAVQETAGVACYNNGALAICYYTASNGGQVELVRNVWGKGEGDYITMHDDPYDVENPESVVKSAAIAKTAKDGNVYNQQLTDYLLDGVSEAVTALGYSGDTADTRIAGVAGISLHTPQGGTSSKVMTQMRFDLTVQCRQKPTAAMQDEEVNLFALPETTPEATSAPQPTQAPFVTLEQTVQVDVPVFSAIEPWLGLSINGSNNEILTVREENDRFVIESRRYGHGVGMSQRGAQWMAGQYGWTYDQILRFYYPGLALKKTDTQVTLPPAVSAAFLTTPGPAATPTPRPTLMPASDQLKAGEWRVKVTQISANSSLNLRSAPSTASDVLRVLYYGQELLASPCDEKGWIKVRTDVTEGYVMEKFVEKLE